MASSSVVQTLLKTLRDIREDFKGGQTSNVAYEDWDELSEDAEYDGKKVTLNKPFRTPGADRKFGVYVKNDKGNVIMVRFGDPNMEIKRDDPDRRSNYRARHGCDNPGPKWKANYWSCRMWAKKSVSDIIDESLGHEGSSMCPTCHSYDVVHQEMEDGRFFNICRKCSKRWETDEVAR
jgi:hypothetical protein